MLTTMDVEVEELWISTVTRTPTTKPLIGLLMKESFVKISPAAFPAAEKRFYTAPLQKLLLGINTLHNSALTYF